MKKAILFIALSFIFAVSLNQGRQAGAQEAKKAPAPKITDTTMEKYFPSGKVAELTEIKKVADKPVLHGKSTIFYETGEKGMEGAYAEGKKDGLWTQYSKIGAALQKTNYKEGKLNGIRESFYESGKKKSEENFVTDKLNGKKILYFDSDQIQSDETYSMGTLEGKRTTFYQDGKTLAEENYVNGKKQGVFKTYFKDGTLNTQATYDIGSLKGPWFSNHAKGQKKSQGQYVPAPPLTEAEKAELEDKKSKGYPDQKVEGHKTGVWTNFHDNGQKAEEGPYRSNKREGKWTTWAPEGYKTADGNYVDDGKKGYWDFYNSKGEYTMKLTMNGDFAGGPGILYQEGKKVFEGELSGLTKNVLKNGAGKEYYPAGVLKSEPDKEYFPKDMPDPKLRGTLKGEGTYMMNRKNGPFKEYHPSGKLMAKGSYMNDKRNDVWTFYATDGVTKDENLSGYYMMGTINRAFTPGKFDFKPGFK